MASKCSDPGIDLDGTPRMMVTVPALALVEEPYLRRRPRGRLPALRGAHRTLPAEDRSYLMDRDRPQHLEGTQQTRLGAQAEDPVDAGVQLERQLV